MSDWKFLGLLISVSVPSFLAALGFYYRMRLDRRVAVNVTLFNLLKILDGVDVFRSQSKNIDPKFILKLEGAVEKKFSAVGLGATSDGFSRVDTEQIVKTILSSAVASRFPSDLEGLGSSYRNSLMDLSKHLPFVAFRLNGRDSVWKVLSSLEQSVEEVFSNLKAPESDVAKALTVDLKSIVNGEGVDQTFSNLTDDLIGLTWHASKWKWLKIRLRKRKLLESAGEHLVGESDWVQLECEINKVFDSIFSTLGKHVQPAATDDVGHELVDR